METKVPITVICFVFAVQVIHYSHAVRCYSCGSLLSSNKACEDVFNPETVNTVDCNYGCVKTKAEDGSCQIIYRGCACISKDGCKVSPSSSDAGFASIGHTWTSFVLGVHGDGCTAKTSSEVTYNECTCKDALCNYASTLKVSLNLMMFLTAGLVLCGWIS